GWVREGMGKRVWGSTAAVVPILRTPYPRARTTRPSFTTATAIAGACQSFIAAAAYASKSRNGSSAAATAATCESRTKPHADAAKVAAGQNVAFMTPGPRRVRE